MKTKEQAAEIVAILEKEYPLAECSLNSEDAWQLLVAVRLSAQCTDARVNEITPLLFEKYPTVDALARADKEDIADIIRPCGLGNSKARDIKACMTMLSDEYGGKVPDTLEELLKLPGVGRKSANLVMGDVYGKPAVVTDTHCIRLSARIGFTDPSSPASKDPYKVEIALKEVIAPEKQNDFCHRLVMHGRAVCTARKPQCEICALRDVCDYAMKNENVEEK